MNEQLFLSIFEQWWIVFVLVLIWSIIWKGMALWHSARRQQIGWFIVFLLVNTIGILEIMYLFYIKITKQSKKE